MSEMAISIQGVSKSFRRFSHPGWRALDALGFPISTGRYDVFRAVSDVDLRIEKGERVALIGRNGAGKSTLLRLISGQMRPDTGEIRVHGRVQALMTLGTGFHPEFTGLENIRSALAFQGVSSSRLDDCIEEISEFTELDSFLQRPVKEYSAGMYARLAFAVATSITPEVLIIDEILGAGDAYFLGKCIQRMKALTGQGATILFVSHDISSVQMLCDRRVWLDKGHVRQDGPLLPVSKAYLASIRQEEEYRLRSKSMSLTKGQVAALLNEERHTTLLRFLGCDGEPPAQGQMLLRSVEYGAENRVMGIIDSSGKATEGSCLIVDPQFMNWRKLDRSDQSTWAFGSFGAKYKHAPFQVVWPRKQPSLAWVQIEYCLQTSTPLVLEQYDAESESYRTLANLVSTENDGWSSLRIPLLAGPLKGEKSPELEVLGDLQELGADDRYGDGEISIIGFGFFDEGGERRHTLISGENAYAVMAYQADNIVAEAVAVIAIYRPDGTCAMQVISSLAGKRFHRLEGKGGIRVNFSPLLLGPGEYLVSVALFKEINLASAIEPAAYDLHDRCYAIKILPPPGIHVEIGTVNQPSQWELL